MLHFGISLMSRKLAKQSPYSPNFIYEIAVHTKVDPVTALVSTHLGRQETFNLQMLQVEKNLIEQSDGLVDESGEVIVGESLVDVDPLG